MRRLTALVVVAVLAGSVAWAAGTSVTSQKLTVDAPTVCSLEPDADTYVDQALSASNFGTASSFSVKSLLGGNHRALVHFDLSTCSIPSGATVLGAELKLYLSSAPALDRSHAAHRVTAAWAETSVTWDDQPSFAATATASTLTGLGDGVTLSWDVTTDVDAFVAGTSTNHGWLVKDTLEDDAVGMTGTYSSREHTTAGERPVLAVTYR